MSNTPPLVPYVRDDLDILKSLYEEMLEANQGKGNSFKTDLGPLASEILKLDPLFFTNPRRGLRPSSKTAAWANIVQKAVRIRAGGGVEILSHSRDITTAVVHGDNGIYDVVMYRQDPTKTTITMYECSCKWGEWSFKRQHTFVGRMCSHALATYYEMQSRDYFTKKEEYEMGLGAIAHVLGDSRRVINSFPVLSGKKRHRFLRVASATVSAGELIDEDGEATNLWKLDLEGTHYEV